ncbi:MAG: hypothetical protein OXC40_02350 [Proteobacteria bacterium]|nr:hypothetical protein [Pseudomonadota bacterium]
MKRVPVEKYKYPNSVNLFKFVQRVMSFQRNERVHNKDIGEILDFKPSDCSHWKRGFKNVKSINDLNSIADYLEVEMSLVYDLATGRLGFEEAYFEYMETQNILDISEMVAKVPRRKLLTANKKVLAFVDKLQRDAKFTTPPLYLPEVLRFFPFVSIQQTDVLDKLTRILRVKSTNYKIQYKNGELSPQTRLAMTKDLARIVLDVERIRFPELGEFFDETIEYEKFLFTAELLCPRRLFSHEVSKVDPQLDLTTQLSKIFWAPKCLINHQLKALLHNMFVMTQPQKKEVSSEKTISVNNSSEDTVGAT